MLYIFPYANKLFVISFGKYLFRSFPPFFNQAIIFSLLNCFESLIYSEYWPLHKYTVHKYFIQFCSFSLFSADYFHNVETYQFDVSHVCFIWYLSFNIISKIIVHTNVYKETLLMCSLPMYTHSTSSSYRHWA